MLTLIRSLRHYFIRYKWVLLLGVVFLILSNVFAIYPAQVVRDAFDLVEQLLHIQGLMKGYQAQDELAPVISYTLLLFGGLVTAAALIRGVFLFFVRQTLIVVSRKIEYDQKNELFNHYQTYSLRILRMRQTGDLMARISEDVAAVRMFTGPGIMYTLNTLTLTAMVAVTMFYVNAELTLYTLLPMPLLALSIYWVHSIINKRAERAQQQLSVLSSQSQEAFAGIRLLRAYSREDVIATRFQHESLRYQKRALRLTRVESLFFPLILLLIGLSTVFAVWIGGEQVIGGTLTLGVIAEFVLYINLLTWPVASLGWITSMIQRGAASQKRLNELMALRSELSFPESSPAITAGTVAFENVSFTYPDTGIVALNDVSLQVPAGSVLGIVGSTGAGKSTLANLLVRFMDPTHGEIRIDGRSLSTYSQQALRTAVGYVPQDVFLFSDTLAANIAFGKPGATQEEVEQAARFAGVYDDIMYFPEGFQTLVGERGVTLSGGQKQRISIARAYLTHPALLLLDDSLSAVDTRTEDLILSNLRGMNGTDYRPTLIIIAHRMSAVQGADNIMVLDDGQVAEMGTHTQLMALNGVYADLYQRQLLEEELVHQG